MGILMTTIEKQVEYRNKLYTVSYTNNTLKITGTIDLDEEWKISDGTDLGKMFGYALDSIYFTYKNNVED